MNALSTAREALALLTRRHRAVLGAFLAVQTVLALLDLLGIILVGVVIALAASSMSGADYPSWLQDVPLPGDTVLDTVVILGVAAAILMVGKSILSLVVTRQTLRFIANRQAEISIALARQVFSRDVLFLQRRSSQSVAFSLTRGVTALTMGVVAQVTIVATETLVLVVLGVGLMFVDATVTVFTVLFFGLTITLLQRRLAAWAQRMGARSTEVEVASRASVQEAFASFREMTVAGRTDLYLERYGDLRWMDAGVQSSMYLLAMVSKYVFDIALVVGGVLLVGSQLLTRDLPAALSITAVFLVAASRMTPSFLRIQTALINMKMSLGEAQQTLDLVSSVDAGPLSGASAPSPMTPQLRRGLMGEHEGFTPTIDVESVSLTYPGAERAALQDVSIQAGPTGTLALVGPTGAGKSSFADVVLGVLEPDRGRVTVSGVPPRAAIGRWPGAIAYVPQTVSLASAPVRVNVALGLPVGEIDDDRVWEALDQAALSDVVRSLPQGLDTAIGEEGARLSGGQRQRLGIARALYTRPRLLVLDEATSALDSETEASIAATLERLGSGRLVVVIAHRLATVRNCDTVAYFEAGSLVASGSFDWLRREVPAFDRQARLLGLGQE